MLRFGSLTHRFQNKRFLFCFIAAVLFIIAVIVAIPVGVVVSRHSAMGHKADRPSVLLPLYIYPEEPGTWEPLYKAASDYPKVDFHVVINPHNGPGATTLPDANYTREIVKMNAYSNLHMLGYVATTYATKNVSAVKSEIAKYAGWMASNSSLGLKGIFFDETPSQYSTEHAQYLQTITRAVRTTNGLAGTFVVHNPGAQPDPRYIEIPDVTIIFEEAYDTWVARNSSVQLASFSDEAGKVCILMHSVPEKTDEDAENEFLNGILAQVTAIADFIYLTGSSNYTSFSSYFENFVAELA